jgi:hypothetical protein
LGKKNAATATYEAFIINQLKNLKEIHDKIQDENKRCHYQTRGALELVEPLDKIHVMPELTFELPGYDIIFETDNML